ncbi:MAG: hypothetical protein KGJ89_05115 [Patescibacteria group bacterium]|nr:hypothetical protein [Patescibacteria group bacterium]MDE2227302.1 hypothetical protein [Patescibacteria group bacterium]
MSNLYDEKEAIALIKALHPHAKAELSHVVRNGLMCILAVYCKGGNVQEEVMKFEEIWHSTFGL